MTHNDLTTPTIVTCGLPYANGDLHIGHLRGLIAGDIYARAVEQVGGEVAYLSGSDVHGTPIAVAAENDPRSFALEYHEQFKNRLPKLEVELDAFGHTDTDRNHETTNHFVRSLLENGNFKERKVDVVVDSQTGEVLSDRYVEGSCPQCGEDARGDECENCGRHLEPGDVDNPVSTRTGADAEYVQKEHGFIELPEYESTIRRLSRSIDGSPQVNTRTKEWLEEGLRPWCITRDLSWGVPDPTDENRVLYVWVDALSEYISATKLYSSKQNDNISWRDVWVQGNGSIVHVIGKDIIQHHTVLWPAMLESAGYSQPSAILASGFVTYEGKALSTSRGHAVWAHEYIDSGIDPAFLRYYLTSQTDFHKDVDFTWSQLVDYGNSGLVDTLGNYLYRVSSIGEGENITDYEVDEETKEEVQGYLSEYRNAVESYDIRRISKTPVLLASLGNQILQKSEPWNLTGSEKRQAIANSAYIARATISSLKPLAPSFSERSSRAFFKDEIPKLDVISDSGPVSGIDKPIQPVETDTEISTEK